jgi:hypothetical protein
MLKKCGRWGKKGNGKRDEGKGYAWMDGYIYMVKSGRDAVVGGCYPRVSVAYHMLEVLVFKILDDAVGW